MSLHDTHVFNALINWYSNIREKNGSGKNNNGDEAKSLFDFFFFVFLVHWSTIEWKTLVAVINLFDGPSCCGNFANDLNKKK